MTKPSFVRVKNETRGADSYVFIYSLTGSPLFGESVNKAGSTRSAYRKAMRSLRAWCAKETRPTIEPATRKAGLALSSVVAILRRQGSLDAAKSVLLAGQRQRFAA